MMLRLQTGHTISRVKYLNKALGYKQAHPLSLQSLRSLSHTQLSEDRDPASTGVASDPSLQGLTIFAGIR